MAVVALTLAVAAVVVLTAEVGALPYIALVLARVVRAVRRWSRRWSPPIRGSASRSRRCVALPVAGGYLVALQVPGHGHFARTTAPGTPC